MEPVTPRGPRTRVKKLRLIAILISMSMLGGVSFVFGMFMSVAAELHSIESAVLKPQYQNARNSILYDDEGHPIGVLSQHNQFLVTASQIPRIVKEAVISIEDKRFETNDGIDLRGIARAFVEDVLHQSAVQGASTIEQQFVKNALQAESHRTIFEKLREAALAFHLDHEWSKEKIITEYLNTIYFGNGAYGIEAAAQTYFPQDGCGTPKDLCVSHLRPWQAALLAGIIQSPTDYDPLVHPAAAKQRRDTVLEQMYGQHYLTREAYRESLVQPLPSMATMSSAPREGLVDGVDVGYFDSWAEQQVIARYGAGRAYDGGLQIRTTLSLPLQRSAEQAVSSYLSNPAGPTASLVAIENSTGDVRAMVGGRNYERSPFNLATEGERQPGSAFKAFDLAAALEAGISPESEWPSRVKVFKVPHSHELFVVHNDEGEYVGQRTLTNALAFSDNTVFAEVGIKVGTKKIARIARQMGITTPISTNYAMTIGGLKVGVTPLDMAHAYETLAHSGQRVTGTMAEPGAPVAIQDVQAPPGGELPDGGREDVNQTRLHRVLPAWVAQTETSMLQTVVQYGTGTNAALGRFAAGKTGTTSNYADAWFVGWDSKYTVAVWVGYPEKLVSMATLYNGGPVVGGSFPALIWHDFMVSAQDSEEQSTDATQSPAVTAAASEVGESDTTAPRQAETQSRTETQVTVQQPAGAGGAEARSNGAGTGQEGATGTSKEGPSAAAGTPVPATPSAESTGEQSSPVTTDSGGTSAPTGGTSAQGP